MLLELIANIGLGLSTALSWDNMLYCAIGVTLGTFLGAIPGIGALVAMSLLFPITFHLTPLAGLVMLGGIYYGTAYGGSIASILLNLPGTPSSAVVCLDGHPMAKKGRAGVALLMTTVSSFFGASVGIILMMLFSPVIAQVALQFKSAEYFSLMLLGLIAASVISEGSAIKGLAMVMVGILLGIVGTDVYTGTFRFTFGQLELADGIGLVTLAMGLFGASEVIASIKSSERGKVKGMVRLRTLVPTRDDVRRSWLPMSRGAAIGSFFGALPGTGATLASFVSYSTEKRISKDPSRFGEGAIEGVVAPESANNASDQTAFIPTLTLGIPGTASMALLIGVLMIHGIAPGPSLLTKHPDVFWGLVMSFWIGNALLLILNIPLIGLWVRVLTIPYHLLYPAILMFICIGVYSVNLSAFDVMAVAALSALGYGMRVFAFPAAPLLLGFVLGPMMEDHFRRAMLLSQGSFEIFTASALSLSFLVVSALLLGIGLLGALRRALRARRDDKASAQSA